MNRNGLQKFLNEEKQWLEKKISELPNGYISEKRINKSLYYYLQHREGKTVNSTYIPKEQVNTIRRKIKARKTFEKQLKLVNKEIAAIS